MDMREDIYQLAACNGKERYANGASARAVLKRMKARARRRGWESGKDRTNLLEAYACAHCGGWHIGRRKDAKG